MNPTVKIREMFDIETLKIYGLNASAILISFTHIDQFLKLTLLLVTICYTAYKFIRLIRADIRRNTDRIVQKIDEVKEEIEEVTEDES